MAATTAPRRRTAGAKGARAAAELLWDRYASACRFGGTLEEREYAFEKASEAEERAAALELAAGVRTRTEAGG